MASGLDLASGVFAGVSIALQLAEAALQLHQFWNRVEDAPKEMQDILNDLLILKDVLRDIHVQQTLIRGSKEVLPTHRPLLKCCEYFQELEILAKKLQLDKSEGVMKRKWKAVKVVFRKDQVIQLRANMESMKITLVLARQSLET
jgi:N-terminal domain on NACHT_NTPase and P-loop NTPases